MPTSKRIGFTAELTGPKSNEEVESREVLGPSGLTPSEHLGRREVFEALVVGDDVDRRGSAFELVSPDFEGLEYSQELLVVRIVVEFNRGERT